MCYLQLTYLFTQNISVKSKKKKKFIIIIIIFFKNRPGILCAWGLCSAACVKTTALFGISENH